MKRLRFLLLVNILLILYPSLALGQNPDLSGEWLPLYIRKDMEIPGKHIFKGFPVIDRYINIPENIPLDKKFHMLADSISKIYFRGLKIQIGQIDSTIDAGRIIHINLPEPDNYHGPGSLPVFHAWRDFFQGSSQGLATQTILIENFLQRAYKGEWIDAVIFYYQGEIMEEWDHINLSGLIKRYK